jgi:fatty-acyl-CoA synthase
VERKVNRLVLISRETNEDCGDYEQFLAAGNSTSDADLSARRFSADPDQPCLIVYTSGTTGVPKGALISQSAMILASRMRAAVWRTSPTRVVNYLPINHIGGVSDVAGLVIVAGGAHIFQEKFEAKGLCALIESEKASLLVGVPTSLQMCVDAAQDLDLSSLQLIVYSGAPASALLLESLVRLAPKVATSCGSTETVGSIAMARPTSRMSELEGVIGRPSPLFELTLHNETEQTPGEIRVKGPTVFSGYWRRPDETRDAFDGDGRLKTGDLAILLQLVA